MDVTCPDCLEGAGEYVDGAILDPGVKRSYECDACGNEWDIVF